MEREGVMRCFITLIYSSEWSSLREELYVLLQPHRFRPSEFTNESQEVFEATLSSDEISRILPWFLRWVETRRASRDNQSLPWSILVTERGLTDEPHASRDSLPKWVLSEFFNTILLEEGQLISLKQLAPELASRFEFYPNLSLYTWRWSPEQAKPTLPSVDEGVRQVDLGDMRNHPDCAAQKSTIFVQSFRDVIKSARIAYGDVLSAAGEQLGGINALVLLSAERNQLRGGLEPAGSFSLFNTTALGLRFSQLPGLLPNLVQRGDVQLIEAVAEPRKEDGDNVSSEGET
jgi:hypothetical protein